MSERPLVWTSDTFSGVGLASSVKQDLNRALGPHGRVVRVVLTRTVGTASVAVVFLTHGGATDRQNKVLSPVMLLSGAGEASQDFEFNPYTPEQLADLQAWVQVTTGAGAWEFTVRIWGLPDA